VSENRAPAQYCPYCGETNLWPHEESHGAWTCRDCNRVFAVRFIGIARSAPPATLGGTDAVVTDAVVTDTATVTP
jgi:transposase-like protein